MKLSHHLLIILILDHCMPLQASSGYELYQAFQTYWQEKVYKAQERYEKLKISKTIRSFDISYKELSIYPTLQKYLRQHHSLSLQAAFLQDQINLQKYFVGFLQTRIKGSQFSRVINAARAQKIIEINSLNRLAVPRKSLIKDQNRWIVVAENIQGDPVTDITHEEIIQLITFVEKTGFQDFHSDDMNMLRDKKTGKIIFIDTEDQSFKPISNKRLLIANMIQKINTIMESKAYTVATQYLQSLQYRKYIPDTMLLPNNKNYDNPDINLLEVRQEYKQLKKLWS